MLNKTILATIIGLLIIAGGGYVLTVISTVGPRDTKVEDAKADPQNTAYKIENENYQLTNGQSDTEAAPGSAARIKIAILGEPVYGDLDGDGDLDAIVLLTHEPGGSGTFYYLAAAVNENGNYTGTNAVFVGDRIAPQTTEIQVGIAIQNYAERAPGEPMSAEPSVGKSLYAALREDKLEAIPAPKFGAPTAACVVAGCSGQLCISREEQNNGGGISTCEYREEYACYKNAQCEVQQNGRCGWTMTAELAACIGGTNAPLP